MDTKKQYKKKQEYQDMVKKASPNSPIFMDCIKASAPKAKPELGELNAKALQMGYDYND